LAVKIERGDMRAAEPVEQDLDPRSRLTSNTR
jgi:hypothetical protein